MKTKPKKRFRRRNHWLIGAFEGAPGSAIRVKNKAGAIKLAREFRAKFGAEAKEKGIVLRFVYARVKELSEHFEI